MLIVERFTSTGLGAFTDSDDATPAKLLRIDSVISQQPSDLRGSTNVANEHTKGTYADVSEVPLDTALNGLEKAGIVRPREDLRGDSGRTECQKETGDENDGKELRERQDLSDGEAGKDLKEGRIHERVQSPPTKEAKDEEQDHRKFFEKDQEDGRREDVRVRNPPKKELKEQDHSKFSEKEQEDGEGEEERRDHTKKEECLDVGHLTNEELHLRLQKVDPSMASALHPNNRRKVLR